MAWEVPQGRWGYLPLERSREWGKVGAGGTPSGPAPHPVRPPGCRGPLYAGCGHTVADRAVPRAPGRQPGCRELLHAGGGHTVADRAVPRAPGRQPGCQELLHAGGGHTVADRAVPRAPGRQPGCQELLHAGAATPWLVAQFSAPLGGNRVAGSSCMPGRPHRGWSRSSPRPWRGARRRLRAVVPPQCLNGLGGTPRAMGVPPARAKPRVGKVGAGGTPSGPAPHPVRPPGCRGPCTPGAATPWLVAQFPAPLGGNRGARSSCMPGAATPWLVAQFPAPLGGNRGAGSSCMPGPATPWLIAQFPAPLEARSA